MERIGFTSYSDPRLPQPPETDDRAERLAVQFRQDPTRLREAEQWVAGTFDGEHYTDLTLALHALHHTAPSALPGSDLLARLYRLAKVEAEAMDAQLLDMAALQVEANDIADELDRAEAAEAARETSRTFWGVA